MATGVNYWSSYEPGYQVKECGWDGEHESSSEEGGGGGGVSWETQAMEVKGQLISVPDPLSCPDRKQRVEQMAELQERRRSLQVLLSTRLAELRCICLQEAELTGAVPCDFPLEAGEKPPCVPRRAGTSHPRMRKCRAEEEEAHRSKLKKTLFSGALRKHSDSEHNTQTHHGKRTVHRGCHTDDAVKSESSSMSDSTGHDNDDTVFQSRPPLVAADSPVEFYYQNKNRNRAEHPQTLQNQKLLPLPASHSPPHPLKPPPHSRDSSSSSAPSEPGVTGESGARSSGFPMVQHGGIALDCVASSEEEGGSVQQGALWVNGVSSYRGTNAAAPLQNSEAPMDGRTRMSNGHADGGGRGGGGRGGRGGYSDVLLDYVWGKQQKMLQRQQSQNNSKQPITSQHAPLYNGYSSQKQLGAPPTYRSHLDDQRRVKVTRTKSCGPFLPVQQSSSTQNPPLSAIQPDPHPHLLPPGPPPHLPPMQDGQLEEATRNLHKALALEGLRDWYLRNTVGSTHPGQASGKVSTGNTAKGSGEAKGHAGGGGALQRRRTTHGAFQQSNFQAEVKHHHAPPPWKQTALPHSATFHGHPLHGRSVDSALYHDIFPPQKPDAPVDQPCPGTLV
ncbi:FERM domain-containing protein 4B [Thalassophryne amazonica]|uniref:FERM domain-containing protein 4B n=1 Tax=Thalassophryne amazonica TaxID=390379 RepID=UPI00147115A6|nr:FERM domain-containing protein 4B [Thalassophryne amazonica]XP_034027722.1 FERM domain-containing protein 4B [Thalassophryne amazonica]